MIGRITMRRGNEVVVAELNEHGQWETVSQMLRVHLEQFYNPFRGPFAGQSGATAVREAAAALEAEYEILQVPERSDATIS